MKDLDWTLPAEQAPGLFTPHMVLPSQFFSGGRSRGRFEGERRLLLALLEDAIQIYCKHIVRGGRRNRRLLRETEEWIESTDRRWVFSFERVCEALELDASYLRRGLRSWRRQSAAGRLVLAIDHVGELRQASQG
jgi:hypothetical protein